MLREKLGISFLNILMGRKGFQKAVSHLLVSSKHFCLVLINRGGVPLHSTVKQRCNLLFPLELKQPYSCACWKTVLVKSDLEPLKQFNDHNKIITCQGSINHFEIKPFLLLGNFLSYL